jgi:hypothetical protein
MQTTPTTTNVDYLVVGAGAMGMAFTDVILSDTDATVALVDRYGRPGGHWTCAYPHVRLHQPSAFYGVNSRELGTSSRDVAGWNAGLNELASGAEVVAYFDQVMNQQFLASGRVEYLPMTDHLGSGDIRSRATGRTRTINGAKIVDATYMNVTVPSMRPPAYAVADGITCVPPNALGSLDHTPSEYVVVGGGKTAMDACLFLLANQVDPDLITWIVPRDSWLLDRAKIQPGPDFFAASVGGFAAQTEASALATSVDDLFDRLEASGQLLRLDPGVRPTMYRCATVTLAELEQLRRIDNVVRLGRVTLIGVNEIVLDDGTIPTSPDALHVDCTADGLERRPVVPVFDGDRMTLQTVRTCQQVFSAAFIGHVESTDLNEAEKNELCTVVPHPDSDLDWIRTTLGNNLNSARWGARAETATWLDASRLNPFSGNEIPADSLPIVEKLLTHAEGSITNLQRLVDEIGN